MNPVFASLRIDMFVAAGFGAVGGIGIGLLQKKGFEMPHWYKELGVKFADLGFIADILIGVLVALIIYAINPLTDIFKLFVVTVTAGIGGTAILENYINGKALIEPESLAEQSQQIAKTAVDALDSYQKAGPRVLSQINANALSNQLSELQKTSKLRKRFRG